jgi:hypothetical protein
VGIVYSVKVPFVVCGVRYVAGNVGVMFLELGTVRSSRPPCGFLFLVTVYHHNIAVQSQYTNPTILSYGSGRTSPSVNILCLCIVLPSLTAIAKAIKYCAARRVSCWWLTSGNHRSCAA